MFFEGPITTFACAAAASLGLLNIWIILILSLLGNMIPDLLLYSVGRVIRTNIVEKIVGYFGLNKQRIKVLETGFKKHTGKTLVFAKINPIFPVPGLILAGFTKVKFKRFIFIDSAFNLTASIIPAILGFYSGIALSTFSEYLNIGSYIILLIIPLILIIYLIFRRISKKISKDLKN